MFLNRVILVSGGTKGIGKSIVKEFLGQHAQVISIYSKDESAAEKLKAEVSNIELENLTLYKGSICDLKFLGFLMQEIQAKFGRLDILVNNAGITKDALFLEMHDDEWDAVISTNVKGTINLSLLAAKLLIKSQGKSHIINISSISGIFGRAGQANYACSKGAIIGLTKLLAKMDTQFNIQVNTVIPGLIEPEMVKNLNEEKISEVLHASILKRMGTAEEIAKVVMFLASDASSYISGTCIKVDGGFLK